MTHQLKEQLVAALDTVFGFAHALSSLTAQLTVGRGAHERLRAEGIILRLGVAVGSVALVPEHYAAYKTGVDPY